MNDRKLLIGIDVGWSEKSASCGVAIIDPMKQIEWPNTKVAYGDNTRIECCKFRLSELLTFLRKIPTSDYTKIVVVIDGPLGPNGPPLKNRDVDSAFRRSEFNGRMQPMDIEGNDGATFVEATYKVANSFADFSLPWPFSQLDRKFIIAETHPTVGLALLNRKHDVSELPSRKRPLVPPSDEKQERAIRAKSDFYWRISGNRQCESILQCIGVSVERDHERVAALYCLAVAKSLSDGNATAVGTMDSGVYVFPKRFHSDWIESIKSIGYMGNEPCVLADISCTDCFSNWISANGVKSSDQGMTESLEESDKTTEPEKPGDFGGLLLNDNGGVHEKHNSWLSNFSSCIDIRFIQTNLEARLVRANNDYQWKIDSIKGTALHIARHHGFEGNHLSSKNSLLLEFEVIRDCSRSNDA